MSRAIRHFKKWNEWRKHSLNSWLHDILVLFGIIHSPTFALFVPSREWSEMWDAALNGARPGCAVNLGKRRLFSVFAESAKYAWCARKVCAREQPPRE